MKAGDLIKFVCASPRWKNEDPRVPAGMLGKTGVVIKFCYDDAYGWGGVWDLIVEGEPIQYYGDFMEVINEIR